MHPPPSVAECRIAQLRVPCRDLAAEYSQDSPHPDLDSHPVCAPVAGHVRSVAVKGGKLAPSLPVPRLDSLSLPVEVVHRAWVYPVQTVKVKFLPEVLRESVVHRASVCLAQTEKVKHLLERLSPPAARARVCLGHRAQPAPFQQAQPWDSRQEPLLGCHQVARPRELAVEYSWDFRS